MEKVRIGIIGCGFAADFHLHSYSTVPQAEVVAVAARTKDKVEAFARRHGIPEVYTDYRSLLDRKDLDLVDVVTPVHIHAPVVIEAANAGKHVVCEKPLTAYCGEDRPEVDLIGKEVSRKEMFEKALANTDAMLEAVRSNGVKLMYAENWVYAPALERAKELIRNAGGGILDVRAEESHSGSHSPFAFKWRTSGGGALLRLGSHPIGAVLHLKAYEGRIREDEPIVPVSVVAEVADLTQTAAFARRNGPESEENGKTWLVNKWEDVENWSSCIISFSDGSRATIVASDIVLGGIKNTIEICMTNARLQCNIDPNDMVVAFTPDSTAFENVELQEKIETKAGYSFPAVGGRWLSGQQQEGHDFVACVLDPDRQPLSDGELGRDVVRVIYAGYLSAEEGRRVDLTPLGQP